MPRLGLIKRQEVMATCGPDKVNQADPPSPNVLRIPPLKLARRLPAEDKRRIKAWILEQETPASDNDDRATEIPEGAS